MEKKRKNRLFYLLLLLFITSISLSVSSYAWFTSNRLVKVDLLNVSVKAQGGIEISVDGSNWKSSVSADDITKARENYPSSVNQIPNVLEPVSSVMDIDNGKVKLFYGVALNNSDGDYVLDTTRSIEEESFGNESSGKFVTFDLFLKVNKDTDLYLTKIYVKLPDNSTIAVYRATEDKINVGYTEQKIKNNIKNLDKTKKYNKEDIRKILLDSITISQNFM